VTVPIADLIDRGIKAYLVGREKDALIAFREALRLDPDNAKARWYVEKLEAATRSGAPAAASAARTPSAAPPAAAAAAVPASPARPRPAAAPAVPLPAPPQSAPWLASPADLDLPDEAPEIPQTPRAPARAVTAGPGADADGPVPGGGEALDAAALPALPEEEYAPSPWDDGPAAPATIVLDPTGGLDLGAISEKSDLRPLVPEGARPAPGPKNDVEVWLSAAKELFALGDFSGSLELIEKILQIDPDHGEARDYLRQNEATLISMYESKLGSLSRVPLLAVKPEEVLWLNLDHRAGFLLAQIDGTVDYESLFALSGLPRLDTARILANLIADGVITS
jgi:tetratricopeptide (TPR) repeat protein